MDDDSDSTTMVRRGGVEGARRVDAGAGAGADPAGAGVHPAAVRRGGDACDALPVGALLAALESVALGVALLDDEMRLVYANAAARTLLAACGLAIVAMELRCADGATQAAWLAAVRDACRRDQRQLVDVGLRGRQRPVAVVPLTVADGRRWAGVIVGRDELCGPLELQMFASRHRLTHAEGEVLRKLALGSRAADIAAAHGVALSTVLTQVAALRSKTLASSVRDVLAMLARLPPLRCAHAWSLRREGGDAR